MGRPVQKNNFVGANENALGAANNGPCRRQIRKTSTSAPSNSLKTTYTAQKNMRSALDRFASNPRRSIMADVNVKNQSSNQASTEHTQAEKTGLQRQQGGASLSRSRGMDPFGFSLSPAEFFNANPFTLMRRMSEEMDKTFGRFFGQTSSGAGGWYPAVEITEHDGQLHVFTPNYPVSGRRT
jgi:hypothetical protein